MYRGVWVRSLFPSTVNSHDFRAISAPCSKAKQRILWLPLLLVSLCFVLAGCTTPGSDGQLRPGKQQTLEAWRRLTSQSTRAPKAFIGREHVRVYFWSQTNTPAEFEAELSHNRLPTDGYEVSSAILRLRSEARPLPTSRHWREAQVIAGGEWHQLVTNLIAVLTPPMPGRGSYYRGLMGERFLYRDLNGTPRFAPVSEPPPGVKIDHRYSIEETLEILARRSTEQLTKTHSGQSHFLLMAPNSRHFPQPLLVDAERNRCVWLSPVDFYRSPEPGHVVTGSARSLSALICEGHGLALLKNPVSSVGRLGNLIIESFVSLIRLPLPGPPTKVPELAKSPAMDLAQWEGWLDKHTHTHQEQGSLRLMVDGEQFFPTLEKAVAQATNHVHTEVFILDNDDVAVEIANQLKTRSEHVKTDVIVDRLGTIAAALISPMTHAPTNFIPPESMTAYLKEQSKVRVHPFLNPFASYDHSKVYLVDGIRAWLGGMNIGREYRSEWHDMMVELSGPVVTSLENDFRLSWAHESLGGDLAYLVALLSRPEKKTPMEQGTNAWTNVRLLPTRTTSKPFNKAVLGALRQAQSYAYVENAYLFDKRVITAMVGARGRGVDVRAILPRSNDSKTARRAELVIANYFLNHGVRVYVYPGMTHVKALLVDDWACVGSANLNQFGLKLCQEHNISTSDHTFSARLKKDIFEADFNKSYELTRPVSTQWLDWLADIVVEGL
jgi:cardiolipin synthase A/B